MCQALSGLHRYRDKQDWCPQEACIRGWGEGVGRQYLTNTKVANLISLSFLDLWSAVCHSSILENSLPLLLQTLVLLNSLFSFWYFSHVYYSFVILTVLECSEFFFFHLFWGVGFIVFTLVYLQAHWFFLQLCWVLWWTHKRHYSFLL